jgi:hypothetical protein
VTEGASQEVAKRDPTTRGEAMAGLVPLPTLLSHALVAFTIDVDNRFEQQMPHRTTMGRQSGEPARGP